MLDDYLRILVWILSGIFILLIFIGNYWEKKSLSVHKGKIISKHHQPEGTHITLSLRGPVGVYYHAPSWTIEIKGIDAKGKQRSRTVNVRKEEWERLKIGQKYRVD